MSSTPEVNIYTLQQLRELAHDADTYLNQDDNPEQAKVRGREMINELDAASKGLTRGRYVTLSGICKVSSPRTPEEGIIKLVDTIELGQISGKGDGFTVCDFETDFDDIPLYEDGQGELLEQMRDQARGRYSICHLILNGTIPHSTSDYINQADVRYGSYTPVTSGDVFMDLPLAMEDREHEISKILTQWEDIPRASLRAIDARLSESDDPLRGLIMSAGEIRHLLTGLNPRDQLALADHLTITMIKGITGKRFAFPDGLPPSLRFLDADTTKIGYFPTGQTYTGLVEGLTIGTHYEEADNGQEARVTGQKGMFVRMTMEERGSTIEVAVPLEHLSKYKVQEIGLDVRPSIE
jgi:hypothetical protein